MKLWTPFLMALALAGHALAAAGDTTIARWKDGKTAAFLIMFDDGWPSHWQVAVPELQKRGMTATFYINPEKGEYKKFEDKWRNEIPQTGMVYGNHTMTHQGVKDLENAEWEIGACTDYIRGITKKPKPELVSYGQPGVGEGKWNLSEEDLEMLLKKHGLIARPPFRDHGAVYHLKTTGEMLALADKGIAAKGVEYIVFHGVERITPDWKYQDMWAMKQDIFFPFLDGLKERVDKGELWITDHITCHKYETQRDAAEVKTLRTVPGGIELELSCKADPALYDGPLTLLTEVPASWKTVTITQGEKKAEATVKDGKVTFDAIPGIVRLVGR